MKAKGRIVFLVKGSDQLYNMQLSHENECLETSIWCSNIKLIGELSMSSSCGMEREEISTYWKVREDARK